MGDHNISNSVRLDVEARFFQATIRTARLALMQELRSIRHLLLLIDLFPPAGWFGSRARLELAEDSHAKASDNLKRALDQIDAIGAAITPTPDTTTAEVATGPVTRSGRPKNPDFVSTQGDGDSREGGRS